eukprot:1159566-Pelagomonas_calceolata.AAC.20
MRPSLSSPLPLSSSSSSKSELGVQFENLIPARSQSNCQVETIETGCGQTVLALLTDTFFIYQLAVAVHVTVSLPGFASGRGHPVS